MTPEVAIFGSYFAAYVVKILTRNLLSHDFIPEKHFNFRHKSSHTMQSLVIYVKLL